MQGRSIGKEQHHQAEHFHQKHTCVLHTWLFPAYCKVGVDEVGGFAWVGAVGAAPYLRGEDRRRPVDSPEEVDTDEGGEDEIADPASYRQRETAHDSAFYVCSTPSPSPTLTPSSLAPSFDPSSHPIYLLVTS